MFAFAEFVAPGYGSVLPTAAPSVDSGINTSCAMEQTDSPFEVHLQNGFRDDLVEIERNGAVEAEVTVTTRFQIGAADVIHLRGQEGDKLTIRLPARGGEISLRLSHNHPYILVQNEAGQLRVNTAEQSPRYA